MILVFLGPPGSGKGTQAKMLLEKIKMPHVALGDMLREAVAKGTELGKKAAEFMNQGMLVPNEITIAMTRERLAQDDCKNGFIIDGFPRNMVQAEAFDRILDELKYKLDRVIYFTVPLDQVVQRLSGRRSCRKCGAVYHVKFKPPKSPETCDACGGELYQRADDAVDVIKKRFTVYEESTRPLITHYEEAGKLVKIDAGGDIDRIFSDLLKIIDDDKNKKS